MIQDIGRAIAFLRNPGTMAIVLAGKTGEVDENEVQRWTTV